MPLYILEATTFSHRQRAEWCTANSPQCAGDIILNHNGLELYTVQPDSTSTYLKGNIFCLGNSRKDPSTALKYVLSWVYECTVDYRKNRPNDNIHRPINGINVCGVETVWYIDGHHF